ncbi:AraC family transcriptional regulator [Permianibacter sp. IMCC34836]|uniref:AraC family transcriptional regulator n=1 Tax=Permianibacter fluminis TaxID=2738515 RepID=UPI001556A68A|nr:AraC family transcriptional regulator [Permianibacter fluminis]NQD38487.1 AraC family transcriptional regulator [Permianibacter fluminis]
MSVNTNSYLARFHAVLRHIDSHLDEELNLEQLAAVAAFSKFHFHRQFSELFGISIAQYVQVVRLKRAAYQLAFREQPAITDIALASGYENPESFSRAFKRSTGQSPSAFRKAPQWAPWQSVYEPVNALRNQHMSAEYLYDHVQLIAFPTTRVAVLEHRGDPRLLGDSIRQFIAWRKQQQLPPRLSATFNVLYDDPETTAPAAFRLDLCAATDRDIPANDFGIVAKTIPAGRCAVLRHTGTDDTLGASIRFLYSEWLPQSGEELRDYPLFLQRVRFFPDVPEHEAIVDIFLPLQ